MVVLAEDSVVEDLVVEEPPADGSILNPHLSNLYPFISSCAKLFV